MGFGVQGVGRVGLEILQADDEEGVDAHTDVHFRGGGCFLVLSVER